MIVIETSIFLLFFYQLFWESPSVHPDCTTTIYPLVIQSQEHFWTRVIIVRVQMVAIKIGHQF